MRVKGREELLAHLPDFSVKKFRLLLPMVFVIAICTVVVLYILDLIPSFFPTISWLSRIEPFIPFIGSVIAVFGGLTIVHQTWRKKEILQAKYKEKAF
ncbi:MAG: hypothetical protein ACTSQE_00020 [Candidatus Heimdallarchaeaceae archaeon]